MAKELISFIGRLRSDAAFRKRFVKAPARLLSKEGFEADALALPDRIDEHALVAKLDKVLAGDQAFAGKLSEEAAHSDLSKLTPNQLWERFGLIGPKTKPGGGRAGAEGMPSLVAVVIYGVSIVTGPSTLLSSVATVAQLKALRQLARLPADKLSFSVMGSGETVQDLSVDVLRAFLERIPVRKR